MAMVKIVDAIADADIARGAQIARSIIDPASKAAALTNVAAVIADRDPAHAASLCEEAIEAARSVRDLSSPITNFYGPARVLAEIADALIPLDPSRGEQIVRL